MPYTGSYRYIRSALHFHHLNKRIVRVSRIGRAIGNHSPNGMRLTIPRHYSCLHTAAIAHDNYVIIHSSGFPSRRSVASRMPFEWHPTIWAAYIARALSKAGSANTTASSVWLRIGIVIASAQIGHGTIIPKSVIILALLFCTAMTIPILSHTEEAVVLALPALERAL